MRHEMTAVIGGKRYNTETATVIASDEYWDGSNYERRGTNTHLYRTKNGSYFVGYSTCWQGSRSHIEVIDAEAAKALYEQLPEHEEEYEAAFPGAASKRHDRFCRQWPDGPQVLIEESR